MMRMVQDGPFTTHDDTSHDKPTMSMKRPSLICYDTILSLNFSGRVSVYVYPGFLTHCVWRFFYGSVYKAMIYRGSKAYDDYRYNRDTWYAREHWRTDCRGYDGNCRSNRSRSI